jgi:hypothetical protein
MRAFAVVALIGIVGGRMAAWLLKRWQPRFADALRLCVMVFTQTVVAVLFGSIAVRLAQGDDALRLALAGLVGLLALTSAALGGFYVWAGLKFGLSDEEP